MNPLRTVRLLASEAQRAVKRVLYALVHTDCGGPGAGVVADQAGVSETLVRGWMDNEARTKQAPLWLLVQLEPALYRAVLAEIEAERAKVFGPPLAPATREAAAMVSIGTGARADGAIVAAMADDGRIDDHETPDVAREIRRDIAAKTTLLGKLGGGDA